MGIKNKEMHMCKISVIVPVYNTARYLRECLDSICKQTLTDIEIIVVNDGSTDNSLEICEEYAKKDQRIRIISKTNGGLSSAKNTGLKYISGEYFTFVDSDDYIREDMLEVLYGYSRYNDEITDLIACERYEVKILPEGKESLYLRDGNVVESYMLDDENDRRLLGEKLMSVHVESWGKLYRSSVYKDIVFCSRKHEDRYIFFELINRAKHMILIPDALYYYRVNRAGSIMNTHKKSEAMIYVDTNIKYIEDYHNFICEFPGISRKRIVKRYISMYKEIDKLEKESGGKYEEKQIILNRLYNEFMHTELSFRYKMKIYTLYNLTGLYMFFDKVLGSR